MMAAAVDQGGEMADDGLERDGVALITQQQNAASKPAPPRWTPVEDTKLLQIYTDVSAALSAS